MRILYFSHVDLFWIKQRPQFLSEEMSKNTKLSKFKFIYNFNYNRSVLQKNKVNLDSKAIYKIPFSNRFNIIDDLSSLFIKMWLYLYVKMARYDFVVISHPSLIKCIPSNVNIIYDCMDDNAYFFKKDTPHYKKIMRNELETIRKAKYVSVTSQALKTTIKERYGIESNLVRNAFGGEIIDIYEEDRLDNDKVLAAYIGTISEWLDTESLLYSLDENKNLEIHLYGPIESHVSLPVHSRLIYKGVLEHSNLASTSKSYDYLLMPFKLNELIYKVDPVKIYEYINFNKNIISIRYPEVERFDDFVFFYNNKNELSTILSNQRKNKYSLKQRMDFLQENTWECRAEQFLSYINDNWKNY